jgi:hypothetical protein
MVKVDAEMQRWSSSLEEELLSWPDITTRAMFGMLAVYRRKTIFAALPRTRAPGTPFSLLIKLPGARDARLTAGKGPGAGWQNLALSSADELPDALAWLGRAYERAR